MDKENLNPIKGSIDDIRDDFESYKVRYDRQVELNRNLLQYFLLNKEMEELNADVQQLRLGLNKLQQMQLDLSCCQQLDIIRELPIEASDETEEKQPLEELAVGVVEQSQLMISCSSSCCLFANCRRRVNNQLLLLHYLSDHSDEENAAAFLRCHKLAKDQRIVLSFHTARCLLQQNQVIGLVAYNAKQELAMDLADVHIAVLICKTSSTVGSLLTDSQKEAVDPVFVIWLVTAKAANQLQLQAKLKLCGRDAALQAKTKLLVRAVAQQQHEGEFMQVDGNYWCLSFEQMRHISSNFRDELQLELGINELNDCLP